MVDLSPIVAQLLANTLYQTCEAGAGLNENFDRPTKGYMVSVYTGPVFDNRSSVNPIDVAKFLRKEYPKYRGLDGSTYAGVWTDSETGKIIFDISVNFGSEEDGIRFARALNERAIYDVVNGCDIQVD